MNLEEAYQILAIVHADSVYNSGNSEAAHQVQAQVWAETLKAVPYDFAQKFVMESMAQGNSVMRATAIAKAWRESRTSAVHEAARELIPPDALSFPEQRRWQYLSRTAVSHGASLEEAAAYANQHVDGAVQYAQIEADTPTLGVEESKRRVRTLLAEHLDKQKRKGA